MRKLLIATSLPLLLCGSLVFAKTSVQLGDEPSGMTLLEQTRDGLTLKMDIGSIEFFEVGTKEGIFLMPTVKGFSRSNHIGEPALPVLNRLVAIPFGSDLRVEVTNYESEDVDLKALGLADLIMPSQPPLSKSDDPASVPFEFNRQLYQQPGFYTLPLAQSKLHGVMRALNLGMLSLAPMEYDPVEGRLRVYKSLTVTVSFDHPDWNQTEEMFDKYYSPFYDGVYNQIVNYPLMMGNGKDDLVQYPVKYAIVSDRMFEDSLQPFIEWKTKKGFIVDVAYTDEIGSSSSAIKAHLEDLYENPPGTDPPPSFVLLCGDDQEIPAFQASGHITDRTFVEYTGDVFPEVYIGRFSAHHDTLFWPQVHKTLEYEQYLMPDPSFLGEVTMIAGVDYSHGPTHGNGQINYGTNLYFNAAHGIYSNTWLYPASDEPGASAAIIQTVQDGVGFLNYTAHCSHSGHGDPSFTTSDVYGLSNAHKYPLGIGNCCLANTFGDDYSTPCMGEAWVQSRDKGGLGYIGGTNSTYWDEDYWWGVGYGPVIGGGPTYEQTGLGAYDGLFHDHGEPVSQHYITNAAIFYCGNLAVTEAGSSLENYYWEIYCIMGDPSVMTYLGVPDPNTVSHAATILITDNSFTIEADPYSYVGLSRDGVLHGAGWVDESGTVTFSIDPLTVPGTADLVVTGQNKQPYITTVQVIAPDGPYVIYDGCSINDTTWGNGDGLVNCGENVLLGVQLINVGPDTAFDVAATLSSDDQYVTITENSENYGTVPGQNGTVFIADAFEFKVAATCPDHHRIRFDLEVTGTARDTWTGSFTVEVHSPAVSYVEATVIDAGGNNNGIADPGETAQLYISLENAGSASASAVEGILTEDDIYVTVLDDYGHFGDLPADGGTGDNSSDLFEVTVDQACPMGHEMTFSVELTAESGYSAIIQFQMIIGDREIVYFDDFSFDQGWNGLGGSGEWTIGAAVGGSGSDGSGGPDPSEDHTPGEDNNVLGNDLTSGSGGDYNSGLGQTYWVTSPVIDCDDYDGVQIKFYRWLGVESSSYDHTYLQVFDGSNWRTIFENGSTMDDQAWIEEFYDISQYADYNLNFQIRFGMGSTDGSAQYCGWNIDDLIIRGYNQATGTPAMQLLTTEIVDTVFQGESKADTVWVKNNGDGKLKITFSSESDWLEFYEGQVRILPLDSLGFEVTINTAGLPCGDHVGSLSYSTNDPNNFAGDVPVSLNIPAPEVALSVQSINEILEPGAQTTVEMTVNNDGPGPLHYIINCQMFEGKGADGDMVAQDAVVEPLGYHPGDADKGDTEEPFFPPQEKGMGGPDDFGYRWTDSDEPGGPVFEWVDISAVGTAVLLDDDNFAGPFAIGFGFPYYDSVYTELYIGSNGIVTFGAGSGSRSNRGFPDPLVPNNLIAIWWDDIDPEHQGTVYYYHDAANGRFIVSFDNVPNYQSPSGTGSLSFQAILFNNGKILMQYGTMDPGDDTQGLSGASIGIENEWGGVGLGPCYNQPYMHDNMAILFYAWRWLAVAPAGGTIDPFGNAVVTVTLDAADLADGVYTGQLNVDCNDPDEPTTVVPVTLEIAGYLCGDVNNDGEGPNVVDLNYMVTYLFNQGPPPDIPAAANMDGAGPINIADLTYLIEYLFNEGDDPICGEPTN